MSTWFGSCTNVFPSPTIPTTGIPPLGTLLIKMQQVSISMMFGSTEACGRGPQVSSVGVDGRYSTESGMSKIQTHEGSDMLTYRMVPHLSKKVRIRATSRETVYSPRASFQDPIILYTAGWKTTNFPVLQFTTSLIRKGLGELWGRQTPHSSL